jgi:CDP-paratose 2-epimerase
MSTLLITGSSGLVGSEAVLFFDNLGWKVYGVDNNMRRDFFGSDGDTTWILEFLTTHTNNFTHYGVDVRDRHKILEITKLIRPDLIIHCAAQPSHDLAKERPFDDFDINAVGTLNLLQAVYQYCPESPFIFLSTNKVYGDVPNEFQLVEESTRYDYAEPLYYDGIDESCRVDACLHSLFGASKLAADILVQEYGRYFNMPTVCFRCGCITGPKHSGAKLHGFLSYLAKSIKEERTYQILGYKGKQVRDSIHSYDLCTAFLEFYKNPRCAVVYNMGGGRQNSISILEAITRFQFLTGKKAQINYIDKNRIGDHICYISNLNRFKLDYPNWTISRSLEDIFFELVASNRQNS